MSRPLLKPSVPRSLLLLLAGSTWGVAGVALCLTAFFWLTQIYWVWALHLGLLGFGMAIGLHRFGFSKIASKNIERISHIPEKACVFAFQAWRGYLTLSLMVVIGAVLRQSSLPKPCLAVVYAGIGGALILASRLYYTRYRMMQCLENS